MHTHGLPVLRQREAGYPIDARDSQAEHQPNLQANTQTTTLNTEPTSMARAGGCASGMT